MPMAAGWPSQPAEPGAGQEGKDTWLSCCLVAAADGMGAANRHASLAAAFGLHCMIAKAEARREACKALTKRERGGHGRWSQAGVSPSLLLNKSKSTATCLDIFSTVNAKGGGRCPAGTQRGNGPPVVTCLLFHFPLMIELPAIFCEKGPAQLPASSRSNPARSASKLR